MDSIKTLRDNGFSLRVENHKIKNPKKNIKYYTFDKIYGIINLIKPVCTILQTGLLR